MMIIKMENGIGLKKFLKITLIIFFFSFISFTKSFSNELSNLELCLDQTADEKKIKNLIKNYKTKDLIYLKEKKDFLTILNGLKYIKYCYNSQKNIYEYLTLFEEILDSEIISLKTFNQLDYNFFFQKEDWGDLLYSYVLDKSVYNFGTQSNNLKNEIPSNLKEYNHISKVLEILNSEKETNLIYITQIFNSISLIKKFNHNRIIEILDENLEYAKKNPEFFSHYVILASSKIEYLKLTNVSKCKEFYEKDFKKNYLKNKNSNYPQYLVKINNQNFYEINQNILNIFDDAFVCISSFSMADESLEAVQELLKKENSADLKIQLAHHYLSIVFWQTKNSYLLGNKKNFDLYSNKYEKWVSEFDTDLLSQTEFDLLQLQYNEKYFDLNIKEKKIINLLKKLSNLSFEDPKIKKVLYGTETTFQFSKKNKELALYKMYGEILVLTGKKLEAVKVYKELIEFYQSLRTKNNFNITLKDEDLKNYLDTNQTLPDIYTDIITLFDNIKDFEELNKYANQAFDLCNILTSNGEENFSCYRVHLSFLKAAGPSVSKIFSSDQIINSINYVDYLRNVFINSYGYRNYSASAKARLENDYLHATAFSMLGVDSLDSKKIIDFKYREKNTAFYHICEKDWMSKYIKNQKILNSNNISESLALVAFQVGCYGKQDKKYLDKEVNQEKLFNLTYDFLEQYKKENEIIKFKYLDQTGNINDQVFFIGQLLAFGDSFTKIDKKKKRILDEMFFESLQFQNGKFSIKTKKNILNTFLNDKKLYSLIEERQNLKIKYSNIISKMMLDSSQDQNLILEEKEIIENKINSIDSIIEGEHKNFADLNKIKTFKFSDLQKLLRKDEALIYLFNEQIQQAFLITKSEAKLISNDSLTRNVTTEVMKLTKNYLVNEKDKKYTEQINALMYNVFFEKIFKDLENIKKIFFISDKYYASYPLDTLVNNRLHVNVKNLVEFSQEANPRYLIQDYEINYLPNIEVFVNLSESKKMILSPNSLFLGVGDPKLTSDQNFVEDNLQQKDKQIKFLRSGIVDDTKLIANYYNELPFTNKEITEIGKVFKKSTLLLRENANEENIKNLDLNKFNIISFATHAEVFGNFSDYSEPFLVLSPPLKSTLKNDGLLTTSEISELNLNANLVILSACNTSSSQNKYAEGFSGLVSAFFSAGTKSVISTYWQVEDKAGYILMTKTIEKSINNKISIAEALRETKLEFIDGKYGEEYKKSFYWAPYVYIGI